MGKILGKERRYRGLGRSSMSRGVVGLVAGMLLAVMVVAVGVDVWRGVSGRSWSGKTRASVVFYGDDGSVRLVSVDPRDGTGWTMRLRQEVRVPLVGGYGDYRLGAVKSLGEQEGYEKLLVDSLQQWLGLIVIGSLEAGDVMDLVQKREIIGVLTDVSVKGKVNVWDRLLFYWQLGKINTAKFKEIDLEELGYYEQKRLPGGEVVLEIEDGDIDRMADSYWSDGLVSGQSGLSVSVINGTRHSGFAGEVAQRLSRVGYDVVGVTNEFAEAKASEMRVDDELETGDQVLEPLARLVPVETKKSPEVFEEYRSQVVVILGEDYWQFLKGE